MINSVYAYQATHPLCSPATMLSQSSATFTVWRREQPVLSLVPDLRLPPFPSTSLLYSSLPPTLHLHTSGLGLPSSETTSYTPHLPPLSRSVSLLSAVSLFCSLFQSAHGCGDQHSAALPWWMMARLSFIRHLGFLSGCVSHSTGRTTCRIADRLGATTTRLTHPVITTTHSHTDDCSGNTTSASSWSVSVAGSAMSDFLVCGDGRYVSCTVSCSLVFVYGCVVGGGGVVLLVRASRTLSPVVVRHCAMPIRVFFPSSERHCAGAWTSAEAQ